jgi:alpha-D-xyloside xylohydrolase
LAATIKTSDNEFDIRFHAADGSKELTSLLNRSIGLAYSPATSNPLQTGDMRDLQHYVFTQTTLSVGESVHGLGERCGAFNVPMWISSRGYGIFIDTPDKVELEVGSERCCRVQTSVEGQRLKW